MTAPSLFGGGAIAFDYRLDGLLGERSTPNGVSAALAYDAAKRPVEIDLGAGDLSRAYDRDGNVTSDGRSFSGLGGDAGSGTASFSYDGLGRVTASSGLSRSDSYAYDRNGNRVSASEGSVTTTYTYDRADQLINQSISGGATTAFAYNAWGDMTTAADDDGSQTAHAFDAGGRMVSLTPAGATAASFAYDALGRPAARTVGSASLTYRYVGTGRVSYATVPGTGSPTYALIDSAMSRLAVDTGGTTGWSVFDTHGNFAASTAEASAAIVNAVRYDAWGATLDDYVAGSGATGTPWRFHGRLDVSPDADEPLYDYGARMYRPSGGTFTQLDTYAGTAQNPLSMNRYLYANANPTTLIDPTGHTAHHTPMVDGLMHQHATPPPQSTAWAAPPSPDFTIVEPLESYTQHAPPYVPKKPVAPRTLTFATPPVSDRAWFNHVWDASLGQAVGFGQGAWDATAGTAAELGRFAWSGSATFFYDRDSFDRHWSETGATVVYMATNLDETGAALWDGTVGHTVDLVLDGHVGRAAGELTLFGWAGALRRGATRSADDIAEASASGASLRIYAAEGRRAAAEANGQLTPGTSGLVYGTDRAYAYGNIAQENLAISARGARVAGYWELPPDVASQFTYLGRVPSTSTWMGGGREWTFAGSIPYESLGSFIQIPWSAN